MGIRIPREEITPAIRDWGIINSDTICLFIGSIIVRTMQQPDTR